MQFSIASNRRRADLKSAVRSTLSGAIALATAWAALQAFRLLRAKHRRVQTEAFSHTFAGSGRRILVVGDSTGVGIGSFDSRSTVAGRLAAAFPGTVIVNRARDRARSLDIPEQIEASSGHFDLTLIFAGSSDVVRLSSYQAVVLAAEHTLDVASARSDHIAVVAPADVGTAPAWVWPLDIVLSRRAETVRRAWQYAMRERTNVHLVDLRMPRDRDPFRIAPRRYYSPDGIHPSADGYALWFAQITRQVPLFAEAEHATET
ncbi:MAG TPA: GDSL-type esterase/lipase family protein [Burkholderiaceae bacterium]|nr:GDSL-type esterase/lipase family protein [Burkholderiaceae bacterium]